jgi:hypothetical protein
MEMNSIAWSRQSWGKLIWCVVETLVCFWLFDTLIDLICVAGRSERETETLNRARQLVFNSDTLAAPGGHPGYVTMYTHHLYPPLLSCSCRISSNITPYILSLWGFYYSILTSFLHILQMEKETWQSLKAKDQMIHRYCFELARKVSNFIMFYF